MEQSKMMNLEVEARMDVVAGHNEYDPRRPRRSGRLGLERQVFQNQQGEHEVGL